MKKFYEEKDNSIDVLFLGSSHMFVNANPSVLWDEYGIASYDLGGYIQPFWNTYHYLIEAYKTQNPKVIVMDVFSASENPYEYSTYQSVIKNVYGMKMSKNKIDAIKASVREEDRDIYYCEYPTFHKRYTDLTMNDFKFGYDDDYYAHNCWKGETLLYDANPQVRPGQDVITDDTVGELTPKNEEYLRKIIELSKDKGTPLVLTLNPYCVTAGQMPIFNKIKSIADEYGVPFINFNLLYDEIGVDFEKDFGDDCHMTYDGSARFSKFLGMCLKGSYDIPDRRGEAGYESYDEMVSMYRKATNAAGLQNATNIAEYTDLLSGGDYMYMVVSLNDNSLLNGADEIGRELKKIGIDSSVMGLSTVVVSDNGEIVFSSGSSSEYEWRSKVSKFDTFYITSEQIGNADGSNKRIVPKIMLNAENCVNIYQGIEFIVYDKTLKDLVDCASFESDGVNISTVRKL